MRRTVIFAGEAGQGIDRTAAVFGKMVASLGYSCFIYRDYSSLIRGGHNFSIVTFSDKDARSHDIEGDALVAFSAKAAEHHKNSLRGGAAVFLPDSVKREGKGKHDANNALLGLLARHFSIPRATGTAAIKKEFGGKRSGYIDNKAQSEAAEAFIFGYSKGVSAPDCELKRIGKALEISDGNKAVAEGALNSGVRAVFYYPMTPATGVFAKLEEMKGNRALIVEQMEDEIAAANAALGASFAGVPAMTGSSGGGLALMSEAVSFSGMAELPAVFYAAQRMGPSTGVPTYTAQGDLKFILNMGPGEFPRLALIPGDTEDAYEATRQAFYFASKYRIPAFIISDKHVAESYSTRSALKSAVLKVKAPTMTATGNYKSYALTESGISPAMMPGGPQIFRATSYEHDEYGYTTEDAATIREMNDKRLRKAAMLEKELVKFPGVRVYGRGKKAIVFAGSPKGAVLDSLGSLKGYKAIQIKRLYPFPEKEFAKALGELPFFTAENNSTAQLASLIMESCGARAKRSLLRYDGRPFTPADIIKSLK